MSDGDKTYTSILLPGARVALFTQDSESKAAFLALQKDWRFARVELEVHDGGITDAIGAYQRAASPDLVMVQTDTIDESFTANLETLAGACAEGTAAIVVGPVNDVNLYRRMIGMGVSDYLVRPLKTEPLGNDIAATLIEKIGATGSRLIAMIGSKGGVGTTVLAEGLAWGLSDTMGQKTFLMDAAAGWSSLSVGMDFEPATTLAEAVRAASENNQDSLSRMMFSASEKLTVLSSGGDVMLDDIVAADKFEQLIDHLMVTYPVIVMDLSAATPGLKRMALARAHEIILITAPTLPAVRAARTLLHEIKVLRGGSDGDVDVIINMSGLAPKHEVTKAQIEEGLERKGLTVIPFDPALFLSTESEAKKLGADKGGAAIVEKMLPMARKVVARGGVETVVSEDSGEKKGGLGGLLGKLKVKG
jgi:pilus assembly protein CpaE